MNVTDVLSREHDVIKKVLGALEALAARVEEGGKLDIARALDAVGFFRDFADGCHHIREEGLLFPALEARGFSTSEGPTAVMRREHDIGRALTAAMGAAAEGAARGVAGAEAAFARAAREYVALLREHIEKEDGVLFPMAERVLGEKEKAELVREFERAEHEDIDPGVRRKYVEMAERLGEPAGVPGRTP